MFRVTVEPVNASYFRLSILRPKVLLKSLGLGLLVYSCVFEVSLSQASTTSSELASLPPVVDSTDFNTILGWLNRTEAAQRQSTYQGEMVHLLDGELRSVRVKHAYFSGKEYLSLSHLNGAPAQVVRQGDRVVCQYSGQESGDLELKLAKNMVIPKEPLTLSIASKLQVLDKHYQFSLMLGHRVAGLSAVQLRVSPLDSHRYQYRFWIDEDSALLLKSQISAASGKVLEQFEFTQLDLAPALTLKDFRLGSSSSAVTVDSPTPPASTAVVNDSASSVVPVTSSALASFKLNWLPPGFEQSRKLMAPVKYPSTILSQHFSDGLASFTVFFESRSIDGSVVEKDVADQGVIEKETTNKSVAAKSVGQQVEKNIRYNVEAVLPTVMQGATLTYSRSWQRPNHSIINKATLMGDVPLATAQKILASIVVSPKKQNSGTHAASNAHEVDVTRNN